MRVTVAEMIAGSEDDLDDGGHRSQNRIYQHLVEACVVSIPRAPVMIGHG